MTAIDSFDLCNKVAIITGGAGLLGKKHAEAILEANGTPILLDVSKEKLESAIIMLKENYNNCNIDGYVADITNKDCIQKLSEKIINQYGHIDILINNAANNPKMEDKSKSLLMSRFETFPLEVWNEDINIGLTGALICSQIFGAVMLKQKKGVILNISSDLGIIAPDQRIYKKAGLEENEQITKPVTYSIIKHGLIGLTKYISTYWADKGIRANTLCPAGVENGQEDEFIEKLTNLIPMGRMANVNEYKSTVLYLVSDASSYMTGSTVIVDGGRTCW